MYDFAKLNAQLCSLAVFRRLLENPVVASLRKLLGFCAVPDETQENERISAYGAFVSELYRHTENLTQYLLNCVLEDENIYILTYAGGQTPAAPLTDCVRHELSVLEKLSRLTREDFAPRMGYDCFLPAWETETVDFLTEYHNRLASLSRNGYGIFAAAHVFVYEHHQLVPVEQPDPVRLADLSGYARERGEVIANTLALIGGKPANNVLLYGDCGTGKSSTVKAIANEYAAQGLRLIELKKKQLHDLPDIVARIRQNPLKFIIFTDDLTFAEDDDDFAALKAILEGSVSTTAPNLVVYATSNRRHLVRESFSAREGDDIHRNDTMQELLSLSDRFGITVTFMKPDKKLYLSIVKELAQKELPDFPEDELLRQAEIFALGKGGRSPRAARQLIDFLKGSAEK